MATSSLANPGTLVRTRGREWVVLPDSTDEFLLLRPIGGLDEEIVGVIPAVEPLESATFPLPAREDIGDFRSGLLLRDAARLSTRAAAGPFRSFARIAVEPRPYQLVPLMMALRLDPVRLMIADDVGIGKTVEAALIARELLDRGEIRRIAVLCPPHLAEQWQKELAEKFHIEAELVLSSTIQRLERDLPVGVSVFDRHPFVIVSTDFIKSDRRASDFANKCPEFVIVDEAHGCTMAQGVGRGRQQRYELIRKIASIPERHLVLVTATPHSGNEGAFRSLLGLLDEEFLELPPEIDRSEKEGLRRKLARHLVQRRRGDIRHYLETDTTFPSRKDKEQTYAFGNEYGRFFHDILEFVREFVSESASDRRRRRIRYWSALALLRCVSSSPAAAVATLRSRAAVDEADEDRIDEIGCRTVLDEEDSDSVTAIDLIPGSDSESDAESTRRKLLAFARLAEAITPEQDTKLQGAIKEIKALLKSGYRPIVFCRFVDTAEYVAKQLREALPNRVRVESVTGLLPPSDRESRIETLVKEQGEYILVCTDCLSEGVNLQQAFNAVIHYDLCWNPTRHEQREGRVDRFGQDSPEVRVITYYGKDNPIDGVILEVLINKHKKIKSDLGVSVAVPGSTERIAEALFQAALFREMSPNLKQMRLEFGQEDTEIKNLHAEWDNARDREKASRSRYAQHSLDKDSVAAELRQVREAIGRSEDVERFVKTVLQAASVPNQMSESAISVNISPETSRALRQAIGIDEPFKGRFDLPLQDGEIYLGRTSPIVEGLASWTIDQALDSAARDSKPVASRCGVIATSKVTVRTVLLIARFRFHLKISGSASETILCEEILPLALTGPTSDIQWLSQEASESLLDARPEQNLIATAIDQQIGLLINSLPAYRQALEKTAAERASLQLQAHERVREASKTKGKVTIKPVLPADILGAYVSSAEIELTMPRQINEFQTIRSEGGLLPPDILRKVVDPRGNLPGTKPEDYGLPQGERINESITQSWNRLLRHWSEFRKAAQNLPPNEPGTGLTNDKWNIPLLRELGFGLIPTGPGPEIDGKTYAINRFFGPTPIHLVGCGVNLDRRAAGVRGAAQANPHGLVQDFLNRSSGHLWAVLSNGLRFRILRDNQALSRQSFLEFDLEAIFSGEVFSDFVLLWLMAHATRFNPGESGRPDSCWLERWTKIAQQEGTRALGDLRVGVEKTLQILGEAFVSHPRNTALRESLRSGSLPLNSFHGQLLRLVYRLIFLFVAEDRSFEGNSLLHPIDDSSSAQLARQRYADHYSTARFRQLAGKIKGSRHGDLWQQFNLLVGALSGKPAFESARQHLALPSLGSSLWDPQSTPDLNTLSLNQGTGTADHGTELANDDLLEALRHLAFTRQGKMLRPVDYKNLGAEELGGVYESLLALTPQISADGARFTFAEFAGNQRKTSGSYYTPDSLVQCLLDSALDPVVGQALKGKTGVDAENALLSLKICDPAVGSGHFLVGAAHRLARHLSRVRAYAQGDSEPSPIQYQQALRDVIGRCLYGVDINPMSAELCKFSLWMEALEPGKPLGFLDHHIQVGNSLLGTTPELIAKGIPNEAFAPITGDDARICSELKRLNREYHEGRRDLPLGTHLPEEFHVHSLAIVSVRINHMPEQTAQEVFEKSKSYEEYRNSVAYKILKLIADTWCSAFVFPKIRTQALEPRIDITQDFFRALRENHQAVPSATISLINQLADRYRFFHWHLAFPEVFDTDKPESGFDVILGNPPWERVKIQEKEWFAERSPEIAAAPNAAARKRMIDGLITTDPALLQDFQEDLRVAEGESHLMRNSGVFPLCGRGDINTYAVFAELNRNLTAHKGRAGMVVPSGIATDDTTKFFFQMLVEQCSLGSLFDFENRTGLFPEVDSRMKFCLLTLRAPIIDPKATIEPSEFVFFAHSTNDLNDQTKRFTLTPYDIALLNPNTRTCPIFRSKFDAELTKAIYRRVHVLFRDIQDTRTTENPWGFDYMTKMFDIADNSHEFLDLSVISANGWERIGLDFVDPQGLHYAPVYEAKHIHHFDHRWGTDSVAIQSEVVSGHRINPGDSLDSRYWVLRTRVNDRLSSKNWNKQWLMGWRDITNTTNERTSILTIFPRTAAAHTLRVAFIEADYEGVALFQSCLTSFMFDFVTRQKVGGTHLTVETLKQLPVMRYDNLPRWLSLMILPRDLELTYSAWDLEPFANDCGWNGPPFLWDDERRFLIRCELDAAFFHLYLPADEHGRWKPARVADGAVRDETPEELAALEKAFPTPRDAVAYIMETFPIVKRKDEAAHGHYRTKDRILEIYDAMQQAIITGIPYQSPLNPPPGPPTDSQGNFLSYNQIKPADYPHIHPPRP